MKFRVLFLLNIFMFVFTSVTVPQNSPPVVSNVVAAQRAGTNLVDITYDVADNNSDLLLIRVKITDTGININATSFTGDVGFNIPPSTEKSIIWNAGTDYLDHYGTNFVVTIEASDETSDGYADSAPFTLDTRINKPPVNGWQTLTDKGNTYNENVIIDNEGKVWCFYLRSLGSKQPVYMKVFNSEGYVYKSERIIGHGSAFVSNEYQTVRAALNQKTGDIWVVIQGSDESEHQIGYFIIFNDTAGVKQDSTVITASGQVNAPKLASDSSGTMWFCWHTDNSVVANSDGAFTRYNYNGTILDLEPAFFYNDGFIMNTDLAVDSENQTWFIFERPNSPDETKAGYKIYNDQKDFIRGDNYSPDIFSFDPRKTIYSDLKNSISWILKKNSDVGLNQLIGYDLQGDSFFPISELGRCSFLINENHRLEIVRYNSSNNYYEMSEYDPKTGNLITNWAQLFDGLITAGAVYEYVAYNQNYPNLKVYLARTGSDTTKIKFMQVEPLSIIIRVSTDSLNFGLVGLDTSKTLDIPITNDGNEILNVTNIAVIDSHFSVDTYSFSVLPGSSEAVHVTFNPSDTMLLETNLTIYSNAFNGNQNLYLSGKGYERSWLISANADTLDFGIVPISYVKQKNLQIQNLGTENIIVNDIFISDNHFTINDSNYSFIIQPGESYSIDIAFTPYDTSLITGSISFYSNAQNNPLVVFLKGQGDNYSAPRISLQPKSIEFGDVPIAESRNRTFTITNIGSEVLNVYDIFVRDEHFVIGGNISFSLEPDSSYLVNVTFTPTSATFYESFININSDDPINSQASLTITGKGYTHGDPNIYVNPSSLIFDEIVIGDSSNRTLYVSNFGTDTLFISSITSSDSQFIARYDTVQYGINPYIAPGDPIMWINITFAPQVEGSIEASLHIESNDPDTPDKIIPLFGTGRLPMPQKISVSPDSLNFGDVSVNKSLQKDITITNIGELPLNISNIKIKKYSTNFEVVGDTSFSLPENEGRKLGVIFHPDTSIVYSDTLVIQSNDLVRSLLYIPLTGIGKPLDPQNISIHPDTLNFGEVAVGNSFSLYFWITNTGEKLLTVSNIISTRRQYSANMNNFSVNPGSNQYVMVTFSPDSVNQMNANLLVISNDPDPNDDTTYVSLIGTGRAKKQPIISTDPKRLDFGEIPLTFSSTEYLKVYNTGERNLTVSDISSQDNQFSITPKSFSIYPQSYRWIYITFTPNSNTTINANLTIHSNASNDTALTVPLSGKGRDLEPPKIYVSRSNYDFGEVGITKQASFNMYLKNNGEMTLDVEITHTDYSHISLSASNFSLNSGQTQYILVFFSPDEIKTYSDILKITSNDHDNTPIYVTLSGSGRSLYDQSITVSPTSMDFGSVGIGTPKTQNLWIDNQGEKDLIITNISSSAPDAFMVTDESTNFTLEENQGKYINIRFQPSRKDTFSATLTIQSNDPDSPDLSVPLTGIGRELAPIISFYPDSIYFVTVAVGNSMIKSLNVYNEGDAILEIKGVHRSDEENFWIPAEQQTFNVEPGENSLINIEFKPTERKDYNEYITIVNNDPTNPNAIIPVTGTGRDSLAQKISIDPDSLYFGSVALGREVIKSIAITNIGEKLLKISKVSSNTNVFIADSSGFDLTGNMMHYLQIKFLPTSIDSFYGKLTIENNDSTIKIGMLGIGRELKEQEIAITTNNLDFGQVEIGNSSYRNFYIQNLGDMPLTIYSFESSDSQFVANADSLRIDPYTSTLVEVTFSPQIVGEFQAFLTIQNNDGTVTINMSGAGYVPNVQKIVVSPSNIDFGPVARGFTYSQSLWISNVGEDVLIVSDISSNNPLFYISVDSFSLKSDEFKRVYVYFQPPLSDATNNYIASLQISSNDPINGIIQVPLTATIRPPENQKIVVIPDSLYFGVVPIYNEKTLEFLIKNEGEKTLEITNVTSSDNQFTVKNTYFSVSPKSNYYLSVYFKPIKGDTIEATLTVLSNDNTNERVTLKLKGVGRALTQKIKLSTSTLDFGTTVIGRPRERTFYISNEGDLNLEVFEIYVTDISYSDEFTIADSLFIVKPGSSRQVRITYSPTKVGTADIDLRIESNDPDNKTMQISLKASCIEYNGPYISLQQNELDFGEIILGAEKNLSFFIFAKNANLVISKISVQDAWLSGYFSINPDTFTVMPEESKRVDIVFHANSIGNFYTSLKIVHNDNYGDSVIVIKAKVIDDIAVPNILSSIGWKSNGYYPFTGVLGNGPDNAWFVKNFNVYSLPNSAKLSVAFKDSVDILINGSLILTQTSDTLKFWNIDKYDVTRYIALGRNRIAVLVYNNQNQGGFDCVLTLDDVPIIKNGGHYPDEGSIWWYYGESGQLLTGPAESTNGIPWYSREFGFSSIDSLLASWNFESIFGNSTSDSSRYGRKLVLQNVTLEDGIVGKGLKFSGVEDTYARFEANINVVPLTIQFWINCYGSTGTVQSILYNNNGQHMLYLDLSGNLCLRYRGIEYKTNQEVKSKIWYFLSIQYFQESIRLFVNNDFDTTFYFSKGLPSGDIYTYLGGLGDELIGFYGIIDELTIYNFAQQTLNMPNVTSVAYNNQTSGTKGTTLNLNFEIYPPHFKITQGKLDYALGGKSIFQSANVAINDSANIVVKIPPEHVTIKGLKCKLNLETNYGTINYPNQDSLFWIPVYTTGEKSNKPLTSNIYRMASVPYTLDENSVDSVFYYLGQYSPYEWRLFQWNSDSSRNVEFSLSPDSAWKNQPGLEQGNAVWLITADDHTVSAGSGWSARDMDNFRFELQPGWNQIGNPFPFTINWDDVKETTAQLSNTDISNLVLVYKVSEDSFGYNMNWNHLEPWEGYYVRNNDTTSVRSIFIPPIESSNFTLLKESSLATFYQNKYEDMEVMITAKARCGKYFDNDNILGVAKNASNNYDRFDIPEAPVIGDYISVWIDNHEWKSQPGAYAVDIRESGQNGYVWNLVASCNLSKVEDIYHLFIHNKLPIPTDWKIYLFDLDMDVAVNLEQQSEYDFKISHDTLNRKNFKVIIGTDEFITNNSNGIPLVPLNFALFQNYPNPFNPTTKITFEISKRTPVEIYVYNILGQRIRILVDDIMRSGHHQIIWDSCNDYGIRVSSGIYFVQLKAEGKTAVKKMIIIK